MKSQLISEIQLKSTNNCYLRGNGHLTIGFWNPAFNNVPSILWTQEQGLCVFCVLSSRPGLISSYYAYPLNSTCSSSSWYSCNAMKMFFFSSAQAPQLFLEIWACYHVQGGQTTKLTRTNRWTLVIGSFIVRLVWFGWQRKCCFLCVFTLCQCFKVKAQPVLHWLAVSFAIRAQWGATVTGYEQSLFEDSDASITATPPTQRHFHTTHTKASTRHNRPPPAYLYWTILSLWTCSNCIWKKKLCTAEKKCDWFIDVFISMVGFLIRRKRLEIHLQYFCFKGHGVQAYSE